MTSFDIIPVDIFGSGQEGRLAVPPFGGFCLGLSDAWR